MIDVSTLKYRNPFREATSSELIENPTLYAEIFSQEILVNETLDVFEKSNVVLTGPQGTGKTMILCLFQHSFLSACLQSGDAARVLTNIQPYVSISINLVQSGFHVFGRRSLRKALGSNDAGGNADLQGASDVLCHTLLRQFVLYLQFLISRDGAQLRKWIGIGQSNLSDSTLARQISRWQCWRGYYARRASLKSLLARCEERLLAWQDFLNANTDTVPSTIWRSTPPMEVALQQMGLLVAGLVARKDTLPLYVVIDQYEVLPELNRAFGTDLQRIVNSLIKARDPYVFYKIGARPYDWGKELRVWGAESRVEVDRDYKVINLTDVLRKGENTRGWLFPKFACDVAARRVRILCKDGNQQSFDIRRTFGKWSPDDEAAVYAGTKRQRRQAVLRGLPQEFVESVAASCGNSASLLDLRLASAWVLQQVQRGIASTTILKSIRQFNPPWSRMSWRKERIEIALIQIASMTNQRKVYCGWRTVLYLSGSDIRAFLRICEEVWELAAKVSPVSLIEKPPVPRQLQTEGILEASNHWRTRDRTETHGGGSRRYVVLSRLGPSIHEFLTEDLAISNPGHSGFSLREADLNGLAGAKVAEFLGMGVNWAMFEERRHTSKNREGATRTKCFLHPILSPAFGIPVKRVKEPFYTTVEEVHKWLFEDAPIRFGRRQRPRASSKSKAVGLSVDSQQRRLNFGGSDEASMGNA